ncbi:MAG: TlpA disulfide reductase family protein, partial [Bacteroidota bacterium]
GFAQGLPPVPLKNLEGKTINTKDINNDGKPMVISFWATWCKPCIKELNSIQDVYEDWQDETGVKLVAVSIDDARNTPLVAPFVNARGWEYDVFIDANSDFKRAMNVVNVPHTFLLNGDGEVVYQHTTYAPGDEEELFEKIQALVEGKE